MRPIEVLGVAILTIWLVMVAWKEEEENSMMVAGNNVNVLDPTSSTQTTTIMLDKKPIQEERERGEKPVKEEDLPTTSTTSSANTIPAPSSSSSSCDYDYDCQTDHTDRLGHKTPLYSGQAICNHEYRFGLLARDDGTNTTTTLQWQNCESGKIAVLYSYSTNKKQKQEDDVYFELQEDATFQLRSGSGSGSNEVLWEKPSTYKIHATHECLHNPILDCPYLHLHKSGDVVLNWINSDNNGAWMARNIKRSYKDFDFLGD
jgi:hypothetical protein